MENATKLLSTNDATVVGVLLFFLVLSALVVKILWTAYQKELEYIKEQDKANLEMLYKITSTVGVVSDQLDKTDEKVDDIKTNTTTILGIIKDRLITRIS